MATLWEQCYDHQWCAHIPLDGNRCFGIHACVRVVEEGSSFFLELQLNGVTKRVNLINTCVDLPVSVFKLRVCMANANISAHSISFDLAVDACIDVSVGPIKINECATLARQHVVIAKLEGTEKQQFLAPLKATEEPLYIYYVRKSTQNEDKELEEFAKGSKWKQL